MAMTERVHHLRQQSLEARETLSAERAVLMTEFYQQNLGLVSAPLRRALAFQYLMEHKAIYIGAGELIVDADVPLDQIDDGDAAEVLVGRQISQHAHRWRAVDRELDAAQPRRGRGERVGRVGEREA